MNIIVCIKQVPDTTEVRINPETNTLVREGVASIINPFDLYALEEGVRLREARGGKVTVISMGPPQVEAALRETIALGADEAVLLCDRAFAGADTWATSYTLARAISRLEHFDLVICGKQAIDGDTAQVGPGIATLLDIPQAACVRKIIDISGETIRLERMVEEGYEVIEGRLPMLITVVKDINQPRLPSLKGKLKAKKTEIPVWGAEALEADPERLGLKGSATQVVRIFSPPARGGGELFTGEAAEAAAGLVAALRKAGVVSAGPGSSS